MSAEPADAIERELVIIKRRVSADGDAHHGGVWKIAYADFMTAMMAFFLVMWLINAANEETRRQVASYFNPVRLVDSRTSTKGLQDLDTGADNAQRRDPEVNKAKAAESPAKEESTGKISEEMLFREPFATLRQIAGPAAETEDLKDQKQAALPETTGRSGQLGGKAYLDPFDPQTWQRTPPQKPETEQASAESPARAPAPVKTPAADAKPTPSIEAQRANPPAAEKPAEAKIEAKADAKAETKAPENKKDEAQEIKKEAQEIEKEITTAIGNKAPGAAPRVEVTSTESGVLIRLTDDASFGMFAIASAEPQPVLVTYMEKIGHILKERPGQIVISGHTDARPFRSDLYDNWRLSTARAHMAYYMLVRGGLDEKRVERIEGHADRDLKIPSDPEAAENRRIEILLREVKS